MLSTLLSIHMALSGASFESGNGVHKADFTPVITMNAARASAKPPVKPKPGTKPAAKPAAKPPAKPKPEAKISNEVAVTIPIRLADTAIIADATVNGVKVSCMFDTGFSGTFALDKRMDFGKPDGKMNLRDFVGVFQADTVSVKKLEFGGVPVNHDDMGIVLSDESYATQGYGIHSDGIMGFQIAQNHTLEIDISQKKMVLHPRSKDVIAERVKTSKKKNYVIEMLPMSKRSVELPVTTPTGKTMVLALDTGNGFYATTHRDVLIRTGMWKDGDKPKFMTQAQVASGAVDSWYMYMNDLNIWGVPVKGSVWSIIDLPSSSSEGDGTVGFGFLKNFDMIIDVSRRKVFLEQISDEVGNKPEASPGFSPYFFEEQGRYIIARVLAGSPAARAGVKLGDQLIGINGEEVVNRGSDHMESLINGKKGSKIKIAVSRGGSLLRFEMERDYMINGNIPQELSALDQTLAQSSAW